MDAVRWGSVRKSSYSQGGANNCVGVAWGSAGDAVEVVGVEDTKNPGTRLVLSRTEFARLLRWSSEQH